MYLIKHHLPSQYGNFKEGEKTPLKTVPKELRDSWETSGLIVRCPIDPLPELVDPQPSEGTEQPEVLPRTEEPVATAPRTEETKEQTTPSRTTYDEQRKSVQKPKRTDK